LPAWETARTAPVHTHAWDIISSRQAATNAAAFPAAAGKRRRSAGDKRKSGLPVATSAKPGQMACRERLRMRYGIVSEIIGDLLDALHVDPARWNGGVGSKLLDTAERQIACSYAVARLEVRSFNTRARGFYARRGWVEVRRYPGTECGSPVENVEMQTTF
jgi:GNAT superfamily N-acetyltransferase